jgi:nuclear pore complex protein Nup155
MFFMICMNLRYLMRVVKFEAALNNPRRKVPPFNDQANVQAISSDIAVLLADWLEEAKRPQSTSVRRGEFPVGRIDMAVDQYLAELEPAREETKTIYQGIKRQLRQNW